MQEIYSFKLDLGWYFFFFNFFFVIRKGVKMCLPMQNIFIVFEFLKQKKIMTQANYGNNLSCEHLKVKCANPEI
jgi:hypothetical protein